MLLKIEVFNLLKKEENLNSLRRSSKRTANGKICFNHALEMSIKKKLVGCVYKLKKYVEKHIKNIISKCRECSKINFGILFCVTSQEFDYYASTSGSKATLSRLNCLSIIRRRPCRSFEIMVIIGYEAARCLLNMTPQKSSAESKSNCLKLSVYATRVGLFFFWLIGDSPEHNSNWFATDGHRHGRVIHTHERCAPKKVRETHENQSQN